MQYWVKGPTSNNALGINPLAVDPLVHCPKYYPHTEKQDKDSIVIVKAYIY